jgi:hypothetical protein
MPAHGAGLAGRFDTHRDEIEVILRKAHGGDAGLSMRRWRWFLLAAGLLGLRRCQRVGSVTTG